MSSVSTVFDLAQQSGPEAAALRDSLSVMDRPSKTTAEQTSTPTLDTGATGMPSFTPLNRTEAALSLDKFLLAR